MCNTPVVTITGQHPLVTPQHVTWRPGYGQLASIEGAMEGEDTEKVVEEKHEESEEEDEWEAVKEIGRRRKVLRRRINEIR